METDLYYRVEHAGFMSNKLTGLNKELIEKNVVVVVWLLFFCGFIDSVAKSGISATYSQMLCHEMRVVLKM